MPGSTLTVAIKFLGDASDIQKKASEIEGTGPKLKTWAKGIGAAIGAAFAVDQIKDWIGAASELQDQLSASEQIFGSAAGTVEKFAGSAADAFGISKSGALDAANTFATFGKGAGLAGQDLAGFATNMTGLAGDLASFRGTSPEQAIEAIGAALRGETEPIRQYGVLLDDATLRARAMKMGLISTTKEALTPQQKVLAAQQEILAQTTDAQGDFTRTGDSAANQQKKLAAEMENTQAALGTALLPVLSAVLPILQAFAGFIEQNASWLVPLTAAVLGVAAAVWVWNAALAANPIVLIAVGIAALIAALILLWQNWDTVWSAITSALGAAVSWIGDQFQSVIDFFAGIISWLSSNWPTILAILTGPFGLAVKWILDNWSSITSFFSSLPGLIGGWLSGLAGIITAPFTAAWDVLTGVYDKISSGFTSAIDVVKNAWNAFARFWNGVEVDVPGVTMPGPIPNIPGFTFGLPDLPQFAKGGIVTKPTLGLLGEAGPEAVVPLGQLGQGNVTIVVNAGGLGADSPEIQSAVVAALRQYSVRNGPLPTAIAGV